MTDQQVRLSPLEYRRVWVRPVRIERPWDDFQHQHTIRLHLRWPTYRRPITSTADSRCPCCGAFPAQVHASGCEVWALAWRTA